MPLTNYTRKRLIAAVAGATALGATTAALAATGDPPAAESRAASASAVAYSQDDGSGTPDGYVEVSGSRSASGPGTSVRSSTRGGAASASARARARGISLFDGLVTARLVSVSASASGSGTSEEGRVERLVVNGSERGTLSSRRAFRMGGYGKVVVLEDSGRGITGLRATLTRAYEGYPPGSTVKVAYAAASARDAVAEPEPEPKPEPDPEPEPDAPAAERDEPGAPSKPAKPKRRRAPRTKTLATSKGFVFPVYGKYTYDDTWGAPRSTGSHEGTDIFAEPGTPVVSVCAGELFRVGTNDVPGNRFYLRCKGGDEFFYAHLAAFAEDARNGLEVDAGHVVGFVGSTGDAEQTPPHLHFEIHPGGVDNPVNPYPFLRAWEERRDVPAAAWVEQNGPGAVEQPGTLVVVRDFLSN